MWKELLQAFMGAQNKGGGEAPGGQQDQFSANSMGQNQLGQINQQLQGGQPSSGAVGLGTQFTQLMGTQPQGGWSMIGQPQGAPLSSYGANQTQAPADTPQGELLPQPGDMNSLAPLSYIPPSSAPAPSQSYNQTSPLTEIGKPQGGGMKKPTDPGPGSFGSLFSMQGTPDNPNSFLKAAGGYNMGGLVGAIGTLLTDMNKQSLQNQYRIDNSTYQNEQRIKQNRKQ